jgi:hypothetical protein
MLLLFLLALSALALTQGSQTSAFARTSVIRPRLIRAPAFVSALAGGVEEPSDANTFDSGAAARADTARAEDEAERWAAKVRTPEVQALRESLIQQYLKLGKDETYSAREVDAFLSDPKRSQTWVRAQELQDMPAWGFGLVSGSEGKEASGASSQLPFLLALFGVGAVLAFAAERLGEAL